MATDTQHFISLLLLKRLDSIDEKWKMRIYTIARSVVTLFELENG